MVNLRAHFDEHVEEIFDDLLKMSKRVEKMLTRARVLLADVPNTNESSVEWQQRCEAIVKSDVYVDIHEMSIDDYCIRLIATEQPVASDLRRLISITKVTSDLERIGDIARYIAIKLKHTIQEPFYSHIPAIIDMYGRAIEMFSQSTTSFIAGDEPSARKIAAEDDSIDKQHKKIQRALIKEIQDDPEYIETGQNMLEITRLIELLGDRATSICEWTIYSLQGKHTDLN